MPIKLYLKGSTNGYDFSNEWISFHYEWMNAFNISNVLIKLVKFLSWAFLAIIYLRIKNANI